MNAINLGSFKTTGATPKQTLIVNVPDNYAVMTDIWVQGVERATGDHAAFRKMRSGRRATGSIIPTGGAVELYPVQASAGAATWTAVYGQSNGGVTITVTGQNGKTITWQIGGEVFLTEALV